MNPRTEKGIWAFLACAPGIGWLLGAVLAADGLEGEVPRVESDAVAAPVARRFLAGAIDGGLGLLLMAIPYLGWPLAALFLSLRDHRALGGCSPGKRMMGLSVAGPTRVLDHVRRNVTVAVPVLQLLLVPVESVLMARGRERLGDRWAQTRVVRSR